MHATVDAAALLGEVLDTFQATLATQAEMVFTLEAAALRTGYSREHLARLIRTGVIPNAGRRGAPRIRASDLPVRGNNLGSQSRQRYNPITDARSLGLVRSR